jgi:protein-S-isoprenylcysteine O-methyltransferase Ste14
MLARILQFLYGIACYLVFLASFLYAIAFVGGFLVPTRLDAPAASTPIVAAILVDALLLLVFAIQHSVMARPWFKRRWTRIVPAPVERSTFVLAASLALALVFWQWRPIGITVWSVEDPLARTLLWSLFAAGWATVLVVTFLINHFDLFGLRQVWLALRGQPYTPIAFRTPLPYRHVRHPLYLGFLLAFWATPHMTVAHLLFALLTTGYILVAIQFEERDLLAQHGARYEQYRRSVPMLLPRWRRAAGRSAIHRGPA